MATGADVGRVLLRIGPSDSNDIDSRLGRPHPALLKEAYVIMRDLFYYYITIVSLEVTYTS